MSIAAPVLAFRYERGGIHLPAWGLWLDPHHRVQGSDAAFVSHAHADHTGAHREVLFSRATQKLMRARVSGKRTEHVLDFGIPQTWGPGTITLHPAGHILGSAMARLESEGQSLLYTGDFKLRPGFASERCEPRPSDILIMETTFGRPHYVFPPTAEVIAALVEFCQRTISADEVPLLLGYSLGKTQEILCALRQTGLRVMLHGSASTMTGVYADLGQSMPAYTEWDPAAARGHVVIAPPGAAATRLEASVEKVRKAVLTGWAMDPSCRYQYQADTAFPLSDHADFPDLLEFVRQVNPCLVYTLHGFAADFAETLRELGYDARPLSEPDQLTLSLGRTQSAR